MQRTGKFITQEQFDLVQGLAKHAKNLPVIAFSSKDALDGGGIAGRAWQRVHDEINHLAETFKLPTIEGNYGVDLNREILAP